MKRSPMPFALTWLVVGWLVCAQAPAQDTARIMTYEEYARADRQAPYVLEYGAGEGRLPTVAFYEGTDWTPGFSQAVVEKYGEAAVVRFLALANRVPVTSVEPDLVDEIVQLQTTWSDEQIKLFYTLRFVAERSGYGGAPVTDAEVEEHLGAAFPPTIGGPPLTIEELGLSYAKYFPAGTAWRRVPLEWFSPQARGHYSNDMARASGRFRDETMLARIVARVRLGDRVFVAVGSQHVHMLEPALTEALGKPE